MIELPNRYSPKKRLSTELMSRYVLSTPAKIDLQEIFDYSYERFGMVQSTRYYESLNARFYRLAEFPNSGINRDEIKEGLRSVVSGSHIILYRIKDDYVFVLRILHHSRDNLDTYRKEQISSIRHARIHSGLARSYAKMGVKELS